MNITCCITRTPVCWMADDTPRAASAALPSDSCSLLASLDSESWPAASKASWIASTSFCARALASCAFSNSFCASSRTSLNLAPAACSILVAAALAALPARHDVTARAPRICCQLHSTAFMTRMADRCFVSASKLTLAILPTAAAVAYTCRLHLSMSSASCRCRHNRTMHCSIKKARWCSAHRSSWHSLTDSSLCIIASWACSISSCILDTSRSMTNGLAFHVSMCH